MFPVCRHYRPKYKVSQTGSDVLKEVVTCKTYLDDGNARIRVNRKVGNRSEYIFHRAVMLFPIEYRSPGGYRIERGERIRDPREQCGLVAVPMAESHLESSGHRSTYGVLIIN